MSRFPRLALIAVAVIVLLPLLAGLGLLAAAQVPAVQRWAAVQLEGQAARAGTPMRLEGLRIAWPLDVRVDSLALLDGEGAWLRLADVRLDWRPAALLERALHVERLTARQARLLRPPPPGEGEAGAEEPGPDLPRPPDLPLALRLEAVELERLAVAEDVLGQAFTATARGEAALGGEGLRLTLRARRTDAVASEARIGVTWRRQADALAVDAHLHSAPGGLAGRLLRRPELPAVTLDVQGDGPLSDWRGGLRAALAGEACADGAVTVTGAAPQRRLGAELAVQAACLPPAWRPLAGGRPLRLAGAAQLVDGGARLDEVALTAPGLSLVASGRIAADALDLAVTARADDMARLAPILDAPLRGDLAAEARLRGPLAGPAVTLDLASRAGGVGGQLAWRDAAGSLSAAPEAEAWRGTGRLAGELAGEAVPVWLAGAVEFEAAGALDPAAAALRFASLRLDAPAGRMTGTGNIAASGTIDLALALDIPDTAFLGLEGAAAVQARVRGDAVAPRLDIAFNGTGEDLSVGLEEADALLGPRPVFAGTMVVMPSGALINARVDGPQASAGAAGWLPWGEGRPLLSWQLRLPDLRALAADVSGEAVAVGLLTGFDADGRIAGSAEGRVGAAGRGPYPVRAEFAMGLDDPAPRVAARGALEGVDVVAHGRVEAGDTPRLRGLVLEARGGQLAGEVAVLPDGRLDGVLRGDAIPLAPWSDLAGREIAGTAAVTLALAPGADGQEARLSARVGEARAAGIAAETLTIEADLRRLFAAPAGNVALRAENAAVGAARVEAATLDLAGALAAPRFTLSAEGRAEQPFRLEGEGRLGAAEARVAALSGTYGGLEVRLAQPAAVAWGDGGLRLEGVVLSVGGGRLALEGDVAPEGLDLAGEATDVPLDLLEPLLPGRDLSGVVDGRFDLSGTAADPAAQVRLRARGVGLAEAPLLTDISAEAEATWRDGRLRLRGSLDAPERGSARLRAEVPVVLAEGFTPVLLQDAPVTGELTGEGPLGPAADALAPAGHVAAGQVSVAMALAGTPAAPALSGSIRLEDGRYENIVAGTVVENITAVATAQGAGFTIEVAGSGPGGGTLAADGVAELDAGALRYDLGLRLRELVVVRTASTFARASGDLTFAGSGAEAALAGGVTVEKAEYDISRAGGVNVVTLDVIEVNRPDGRATEPAPRAASDGRMEVGLSIDVQARRIIVRGRGLDAEVRGDLAVAGTLEAPVLVGTLDVVRGTYDLVGRTFRLAEGEIIFDGGREIDPRLAIRAAAEGPGLVAFANVSGRAGDPTIEFTSDPPYPSDEVLARLLFGRELGELTTAQQIQIARAVAGLAGGGGFDPIGQLRTALGLDVLELSPGGAAGGEGDVEDEGGGPALSAGRYLDEDTFLRLEQGSEGGKVVVERRLGRGLSLETELGGETGGGVGLKWQRDY